MKAVMRTVPLDIAAYRRLRGMDKWDEVWEGVLHMGAAPNRDHQNLGFRLQVYVDVRWARPLGALVFQNVNVAAPGGWPDKDYRVPDLILLTPDRFDIDQNEYFEGAPNVVIEIESPGDESRDKLPFYQRLGVPEVWIIDRDTKKPEIFILKGGRYRKRPAGAGGWVLSDETGIELRRGKAGKLEIRLRGDNSTREELP